MRQIASASDTRGRKRVSCKSQNDVISPGEAESAKSTERCIESGRCVFNDKNRVTSDSARSAHFSASHVFFLGDMALFIIVVAVRSDIETRCDVVVLAGLGAWLR